jgi:NADH:ubiquinone reductase (H+-translocating)
MERKMDSVATQTSHYDIVILGAGYAGLLAALRLGGTRDGFLRVALVNGSDQFVERARLQESVAGPVRPRIPSISALLEGTGIDFIQGQVVSLDAATRSVRVGLASDQRVITFERAIYALGSTTDADAVPGVGTHAYRLDPGDGPRSAAALRAALRQNEGLSQRVVVVGDGATAIEVAGEIRARRPETEVTMIGRNRCGDFKRDVSVERALRAELVRLGVRIIDHTTVVEVRPGEVVAAAGAVTPFDICVWSGGLKASPLARESGLATDAQGRIFTDPMLRSISHPSIFAAGDAAHPVAPTGAPYRLSVFAALTSGAFVAEVISRKDGTTDQLPYSFSTYGQGIAIGSRGVGFLAYPDDRKRLFIIGGRTGYHTRNLFVFLSTYLLKLERKHPGFFARWVWPGRQRVSWEAANQAMRIGQQVRTA